MKVIVRKAESKDASNLVELNYLFNQVRVPIQHVIDSLEANTSEHVFVVSMGDELAGFATIDIHYSFCFEFPNAELTELFIQKKFRSEGLATKLLRKVIEYSDSVGVDELHLRTSPSNKAANALYESLNLRLGKTNIYFAA